MIEILTISCIVALFLLIWMHSEAFLEYAVLFSATRFFLIDDFRKKQKDDPALDYLTFLQVEHDTFLIRLITCPLCFSMWLTLITCFAFGNFIVFPICNILALLIYKLTIKTIWW